MRMQYIAINLSLIIRIPGESDRVLREERTQNRIRRVSRQAAAC